MGEFAKSKLSWLLAATFAVVFFAAFYFINLGYGSEVRVLFIPKSGRLSANITSVAHNAEALAGDSQDVEIKVIGGTSIVRLFAFNRNKSQAESIAMKSARNLIALASRYYDVKNDLDMRIIGGQKTERYSRQNYFFSIFFSIITGIILSFITFILANYFNQKNILGKSLFPEMFSEENRRRIFGSLPGLEDLKSKKEVKIEDAKAEPASSAGEEKPKKKEEPKVQFRPVSSEKKAAAPANLPIGEADNIFKIKKSGAASANDKTAKNEDIKNKLNRLISGNFSV